MIYREHTQLFEHRDTIFDHFMNIRGEISFLEKMLRSENEKFIYITPLKDHNKPNVIKTNAREIGKKTFQHRRIS